MFVYLTYIPILIISLALGFLVFFKNRKNPVNISFSFFVLSVSIWVFTLIFADSLKNYEQVFLWSQLAMIGPAFVPATFLLFVIYYLNEYRPSIASIISLFLPAIVVLIFIPTKYNIKNIEIKEWGVEIVPGALYAFFMIYILIFMAFGLYLLVKKYRQESGVIKMQIKYIFGGIFLGTALGVCTNLIFLFYGVSNLSILGPFSVLIMSASISYAILKYRLMDIRIVIQKGIIYAALFGLTFILYSFIIKLFAGLLENSVSMASNIAALILSLFIVLSFRPLERFFQKATNKIFFKRDYDISQTLAEMGQTISEIVQIDILIKQVIGTLSRSLQVSDIKILLRDDNDQLFQQAGDHNKKNKKIEVGLESKLVKFLLKNKEPISFDWLHLKISDGNKINIKNYQEIISILKKYKANLVLPVIFQKELIGIIILGKKLSGDPFYEKDVNLLSIFSNQLGIAINNAWLFEDLEKKVKGRTRDLKKANNELRRIDQAKTEFISVASHQLRTPLTAIKGILDMTRTGDFGRLNKIQLNYINKAFNSNERLIKLVNDLLNISRIEMGKIKLNIGEFSIDLMIKSVMEELSEQAKNKGIGLILKTKGNAKYQIRADSEQIRQVIMNLIDNAIKYTEHGKIVARIDNLKNSLLVSIADSGRGIKQGDLKYIFNKYTRSKYESSKYIGGEGLGLYIVKKIIEAHNGSIWAESKGKNKGSVFYFKLPK